MSFIIDHFTSFLVGASLLGVILFVQQRGQQHAVEQAMRFNTQTQSFSVAETIERDLENIRNATSTGAPAHITSDGTNTTTLRFLSLANPAMGSSSELIAVAYRLEATGSTVDVNGVTKPVYAIARYVNDGSGSYELTGGSYENVVGFQAALVSNDGGATVTNGDEPADFAIVRLTLESAGQSVRQVAGDQQNTSRSNLTQQTYSFRPFGLRSESPPPPSGTIPSLWAPIPAS